MSTFKFWHVCIVFFIHLLIGCDAHLFLPDRSSGTKSAVINNESYAQIPVLNIPGYQQTEDYTCGPATVMSLLHHYRKLNDDQMTKETEMKIAEEMGTTMSNGTSPEQIVTWLEKNGFRVQAGENGTVSMLRHYLDQGIPVMVEWIDWGGHWVIATQYEMTGNVPDPKKDTLYLTDPMSQLGESTNIVSATKTNVERFNDMWFDAQYFSPGHIVRGVYIVATPD